MDNQNSQNDKTGIYNSTNNSINNNDTKMNKKDYERALATERKLAHYEEQMSQLVDRLASNNFQG